MVVPDQFIDRTRGRASTFFGDGIVAHVALRATRSAATCAMSSPHATSETGRHRPQRRHASRHGRPCLLHARRVEPLPHLGRRHHRHDGAARSEAGPRGGDLLRDAGLFHRLRLLARHARRRHGGDDRRPTCSRTSRCRGGPCASRCSACRPSATCGCKDALKDAIVTSLDIVPEETLAEAGADHRQVRRQRVGGAI